jgi:hypothetical protein
VAVSALVAGIAIYAGAFHDLPGGDDRPIERRALASVVETASDGGVIAPGAIDAAPPAGHEMSVVLRADGRTWRNGPRPPDRAPSATEPVLVRAPDGERVGRIRVWVWR